MAWKFDTKEESPDFSGKDKYREVLRQIQKLPIGKWLVISGFKEIGDASLMQSSLRGIKYIKRITFTENCIIESHLHGPIEKQELWVRKTKRPEELTFKKK